MRYHHDNNMTKPGQTAGLARACDAAQHRKIINDNFSPDLDEKTEDRIMTYEVTAAMFFDSATIAARHAGAAGAIISDLAYTDPAEYEEKTAKCQKLVRSLQDEADRRRPAAAAGGGLAGRLAAAAAGDEWKQTVSNVSRYFATAAGHLYRREVKMALQHAANALAAGEERPPENEMEAVELVAQFIMPYTVPFIGTKRGTFTVEWECIRERFRRLSEARHKRAQLAGEPARQLAQLREALKASGINPDELLEAA